MGDVFGKDPGGAVTRVERGAGPRLLSEGWTPGEWQAGGNLETQTEGLGFVLRQPMRRWTHPKSSGTCYEIGQTLLLKLTVGPHTLVETDISQMPSGVLLSLRPDFSEVCCLFAKAGQQDATPEDVAALCQFLVRLVRACHADDRLSDPAVRGVLAKDKIGLEILAIVDGLWDFTRPRFLDAMLEFETNHPEHKRPTHVTLTPAARDGIGAWNRDEAGNNVPLAEGKTVCGLTWSVDPGLPADPGFVLE